MTMLDDQSLDAIFRSARTQNGFLDKPVSDAQLHAIYDLLKWGPTSANCSPQRIVFVRSKEAKEKLRPALSEGNLAKTMAAPVCAILGWDSRFYEHMGRLFPHNQTARSWFEGPGKEAFAYTAAFRNATLQGAYFMIAARAVGLDCGPMSGFDNAKVDAAFFLDGRCKSNFLCNLGYGDPAKVFARSPRFAFEEVCTIV
jgi:3-hydroxypropanoate dehydrogenase